MALSCQACGTCAKKDWYKFDLFFCDSMSYLGYGSPTRLRGLWAVYCFLGNWTTDLYFQVIQFVSSDPRRDQIGRCTSCLHLLFYWNRVLDKAKCATVAWSWIVAILGFARTRSGFTEPWLTIKFSCNWIPLTLVCHPSQKKSCSALVDLWRTGITF